MTIGKSEINSHPNFQEKLERIAEREQRSYAEVQNEAKEYIDELYTERHELTSMLAVKGFKGSLSRGYEEKIDVDPTDIKRLTKIMRRHPVAFLMTHKTYIDTIVLIVTLARYGMPIPFMFGGINMAFAGLKQLGKKIGIISIRRSFKENTVYKTSLRHFLACLLQEGSHFTWAIEGTRSRTGKIVWPKMGILKYIMEGERESRRDVKYIPVSIVYDLIPDVKEMTEQGTGKDKKPESLSWFINYFQKFGDKFGRVAIRFGVPVEAQGYHSAIIPDQEEDSYLEKNMLPRFAFEMIYRTNQINPVTTVSLICNVLLSHFALTKKEIEGSVSQLMAFIGNRKKDLLLDRGKPIGQSVQTALNLLLRANIVQKTASGTHHKYIISEEEYLPANYYANMASAHLYHRAFIELALVKVSSDKSSKRLEHFWLEIMSLRDLFKFEFFYTNKAQFSDEIEEELKLFSPEWKDVLKNPKRKISDLLSEQNLFVSSTLLFSYLEAYQVVLQTISNWNIENEFTDASAIEACWYTGKEMNWQGRIRRLKNVSKPFLLNGLRWAKNQKLTPENQFVAKDKVEEEIARFIELDNRLQYLQELTSTTVFTEDLPLPSAMEVVPGSDRESLSRDILEHEEGSHIAAFFDLDRTLINGFSVKHFMQSRFFSGKMTAKELIAQYASVLAYAAGNKDFASLAAVSAKGIKGINEDVFIEMGEEVYMNHLAKAIFPESRALVDAHIAKGHTVVIVSAATTYQVTAVARDLGITDILCTRMGVEQGKFTGEVVQACWGEGKADAGREFAETHQIDLSKSYFYTDSFEDLPLLEIVGQPHAVNPDTKLSQFAFENTWPIHRFAKPRNIPLINSLRTGLAVGSIYPSVLKGIATGATSFSMQKGINTTIASLGDLGSKMAGLEIIIKGKENLELYRPAVFCFNHQSSAEFFILSKLIRKDVRAIAKKELLKTPLGPLLKTMGVIFIDRSNKEKAIEALKPAVEALKNGTSIAISPEGTRSKDHTLGKFKKGPFHLAMQSGVPIIPIVIKNAHDAMPKGSAFLRPSHIEVVVLEPVDVTNWKIKNLDAHVNSVRDLFVKELEQEI